METLSSFTLDLIREYGSNLSWMEERRFDWVGVLTPMLKRVVDAKTILVITDKDRSWLNQYIITTLNRSFLERPLLPVLSLETIFPKLDSVKESEHFELLEDMLNLSFPNGYTFFYIGDGSDARANLPKRDENSFMWLLDEKNPNAFYLSSKDEFLDQKLLALVRLLDKSIDASLFMEVDLESLV
jgi:hypothetical protein